MLAVVIITYNSKVITMARC